MRTSRIWKMPKVELQAIVDTCTNLAGVVRSLGYAQCSSAYKMLKKRFSEDGIEFSHIRLGLDSNKGKKFKSPPTLIPLEKVLVEHSSYNRGHLKARLIKTGMLKNECALCGQKPTWQGRPLVLRLDHKNGVNDDARIGNLRLLCPNCDSQTDTFSGRNKVRERKVVERSPSQGEYLVGASPTTNAIF